MTLERYYIVCLIGSAIADTWSTIPLSEIDIFDYFYSEVVAA